MEFTTVTNLQGVETRPIPYLIPDQHNGIKLTGSHWLVSSNDNPFLFRLKVPRVRLAYNIRRVQLIFTTNYRPLKPKH
jgi:hypothetical protein